MGGSKNVLIKEETLDKVKSKLNRLCAVCRDERIIEKLTEVLDILEDTASVQAQTIPVEEMIYLKMKEVKSSDPDLHFKLYKLHRQLSEGKLTEKEAFKSYEESVAVEPSS